MKKTLLALAALSVFAVQAEPLTVAATPVPHAEILEFLKPTLAEQGVELDVKVFTDLCAAERAGSRRPLRCELLPTPALFG